MLYLIKFNIKEEIKSLIIMDEKRKFPRLERQFILSYHDLKEPEVIHGVSTLKDISKGGLAFSSTHNFQPGDTLGIQLKTSLYPVPVFFEGNVVSVSQNIGNSIFMIHLSFTDLNEDAAQVIDKAFKVFAKKKYTQERFTSS